MSAEAVKSMQQTASEITEDLYRRLALRHDPRNGMVMLINVGDGAGFGNGGGSDAISMQTWPSRRLAVTGYEVKASRSDWLRELNAPEKNRAWQDQCHEWYVVAPKDVVKLEEIPWQWGLMVPRGAHDLRIARRSECPGRETVSLGLLAAVFRAAGNALTSGLDRAKGRIRNEVRCELEERLTALENESAAAQRKYEELVAILGSRWEDVATLKARAAALRVADENAVERRLRTAREEFEGIVRRIAEAEARFTESSSMESA